VRPAGSRVGLLSIGINYVGQSAELAGCVNDSRNIVALARAQFGAQLRYVAQLTDGGRTRSTRPSRANIVRAAGNAVRAARQLGLTDLIVHYSGHGTQVADTDGDEAADGKDEAIVPVDFGRAGVLTDDWIIRNVVDKLPPTTQFFGLMDCCHSGSIFDLQYNYDLEDGNDGGGLVMWHRNTARDTPGSAVMLSGCVDSSYSYDSSDPELGASGAMSTAFIHAMRAGRTRDITTILAAMRAELRARGLPQVPMLSSSRPLDGSARLPGWGTA